MNINDLGTALAKANELIRKQNELITKLQSNTSHEGMAKAHTSGMHEYDKNIARKKYGDELKKKQGIEDWVHPLTGVTYRKNGTKHKQYKDIISASNAIPEHLSRRTKLPTLEEISKW